MNKFMKSVLNNSMLGNRLFNSDSYTPARFLGEYIDKYMRCVRRTTDYLDYYEFMDKVLAIHLANNIPLLVVDQNKLDGTVNVITVNSYYDHPNTILYIPESMLPNTDILGDSYVNQREETNQYIPTTTEFNNTVEPLHNFVVEQLGIEITWGSLLETMYLTALSYDTQFALDMKRSLQGLELSDLSW